MTNATSDEQYTLDPSTLRYSEWSLRTLADPVLPPCPGLPEAQGQAAALVKLHGRFTEARGKAIELRESRPAAMEKDATSVAVAVAAGKPDPGDKLTGAIDVKIAAAFRQAGALRDAVVIADRELYDALNSPNSNDTRSICLDWVDAIWEPVEAAGAKMTRALDAVDGPFTEVQQARRRYNLAFPTLKPYHQPGGADTGVPTRDNLADVLTR